MTTCEVSIAKDAIVIGFSTPCAGLASIAGGKAGINPTIEQMIASSSLNRENSVTIRKTDSIQFAQ